MITDAPLGIHCSDKKSGVTTLDGAMDGWRELHATSKLLGQMGGINLACAQWPFTAKERYTGDFKTKTREPILFVGNSYDTATALRNSFNASAAFEGSAVLENGGFGVSFISAAVTLGNHSLTDCCIARPSAARFGVYGQGATKVLYRRDASGARNRVRGGLCAV